MRRAALLPVAVFAAASPALAQSKGGSATVEGDVYLVTKGGDVKRGAATEVALIPKKSDAAERWGTICEAQVAEFQQHQVADSLAVESMTSPEERIRFATAKIDGLLMSALKAARERAATLKSATRVKAPTGINGHYRFASVPSGEYTLFAEMPYLEGLRWWAVPVRVSAGARMTVDLDNNNMMESVPSCDNPSPIR